MTIDRFVGDYAFLSNFSHSPIEVNGIIFPTVEHAFQAAKYRLDEHDRIGLQASLAACLSPGAAKRRGRAIALRPDWDAVRVPIMRRLLRLKFVASRLDHLIETRPHELIEGNDWGDTFWGVCRGQGENHLGRLLMEIRGAA